MTAIKINQYIFEYKDDGKDRDGEGNWIKPDRINLVVDRDAVFYIIDIFLACIREGKDGAEIGLLGRLIEKEPFVSNPRESP